MNFTIERMPKEMQATMHALYSPTPNNRIKKIDVGRIHCGNCLDLLPKIEQNSVALSVWSPPYFVGKEYESDLDFEGWRALLNGAIKRHFPIIKPGGFLAINIADILCFKDLEMPRIQADVVSKKRCKITREDIVAAKISNPEFSRYQLAKYLGCSEQTVDRRLHGNNIRGGKSEPQTRVKTVGGMLEQWALDAGFYPYDRRIWVKDAAWENSRWTSLSYRAVDEFEYIYIFWKPGITKFDRNRLPAKEWTEWGSRAVWSFPSVRANDDHEAKFPIELPKRCIKLLTDPGDVVLDCFMGSGTTAMAAHEEGRQMIGIERDKRYVRLAEAQLTKAKLSNAPRSEQPASRPTKT